MQYAGVDGQACPNSEQLDYGNPIWGQQINTAGCPTPQGQFLSSNLLPKDDSKVAADWGQFAPQDLYGRNFLDATKYFGVDTVGQTLRNASYDIRSTPPNPLRKISPWNQSTILPDTMRRAFNIDDCNVYQPGLQPGRGWAKMDQNSYQNMSGDCAAPM